jgi:uncharacterized membrane protein YraQ (UPF0718 family)
MPAWFVRLPGRLFSGEENARHGDGASQGTAVAVHYNVRIVPPKVIQPTGISNLDFTDQAMSVGIAISSSSCATGEIPAIASLAAKSAFLDAIVA